MYRKVAQRLSYSSYPIAMTENVFTVGNSGFPNDSHALSLCVLLFVPLALGSSTIILRATLFEYCQCLRSTLLRGQGSLEFGVQEMRLAL